LEVWKARESFNPNKGRRPEQEMDILGFKGDKAGVRGKKGGKVIIRVPQARLQQGQLV